ncbi:MAG: DNA-dependent helicase II [Methanomassiliicoccales archaeon PtaU1.Bin124]|nr:MAG: DNA-dependent helicase II [Methanomassiliicoccales archaeon PtaU1.Bin124]
MSKKECSICVGASAGSGKTTRLVGQYYEHVEKKIEVSSILALTFNDEAAANMREKIREKALDLKDEELFDQLNWAQVQTFHSFCSQVLREFHLQAGMPADVKVLEGMDLTLLMEETWNELGSQDESREIMVKVASVATSWRLKELLFFLYERRVKALPAIEMMSDAEKFKRYYKELLTAYVKEVRDLLFCSEVTQALQTLSGLCNVYAKEDGDRSECYLFQATQLVKDALSGDDESRLLSLICLLRLKGNRNMGDKKRMKDDKQKLKDSYAILADLAEEMKGDLEVLEHELNPDSIIMATEHLLGVKVLYERFSTIMDAMKRERQAIDFNDMLIIVQDLLDPSIPENKVLKLLQERFSKVLVDEYQDTDLPQDRIVRALLGDEEDKLFVVGDGKQSIYLFRGADVTIFKEMLRFVEKDLGGEKEELGSNYRSSNTIVTFVNSLFSSIMTSEEKEWEFRYSHVDPHRKREQGSVTVVTVPKGEGDAKLNMAQATVAEIEYLVSSDDRMIYPTKNDASPEVRRPSYGDIIVLLRGRTNLRYYESALSEKDIPYVVEKGVGFFQSQEVMDIGNAMCFLANHMDDIPLYGLLRSPYFGLSDEDLYGIVTSAPYGHLYGKLRKRSEKGNVKLRFAAEVLDELSRKTGRVPVSELMNQLIDRTGIFGIYAGIPTGRQAMANVEMLVDMVRQREQEGFFGLRDLVKWLQLNVDESDKEGQAKLEATGNAVRIMTVHASKGLEFPIVIIPETETPPQGEKDVAAIDDDGIWTEVPIPDLSGTYKPYPFRRAKDVLSQKSKAQNLRLFYVAATRAMDHLVILGSRGRKNGTWDEIKSDGRDWFALTMNGLAINDEDLAEGRKGICESGDCIVHLRVNENNPHLGIFTSHAPYSVPPRLSSWEHHEKSRIQGKVEVIRPSAGDKEGVKFKGGVMSETKSILQKNGMTAADYGTLVHEVMRGKSPLQLLKSSRLEINEEETRKVVHGLEGMHKRFMTSELMMNIADNGKDLKELPFELREGDVVYLGIIDRLVQLREGGWALIDYKTIDPLEPHIAEQISVFKEQMDIYAKAVGKMVDGKVTSYIYLTETGDVVPI